MFQALGAIPVAVPKEEILEALSKGTLDAFEWVGPYDDEKFGELKDGVREPISKVAPYYYYPGWWKGDMQLHLVVASDKFMALPKPYQASLRAAAALANGSVRPKYDAANPGAVKRLVVGGAQLRLFSQEVLEACYRTADRTLRRAFGAECEFQDDRQLLSWRSAPTSICGGRWRNIRSTTS